MLPNTQTDKIPGSYQYGFHDDVKPVYSIPPGLSARVVQEISHIKNEPSWMLDRRLKALEAFGERPVPVWGANLLDIDFQSICYYLKPSERQVASWDKVPIKIKQTFDKLGIPQAEQKFLSGVGAQYDSEAIYHNLKEEWKKQGVIFMDMDSGLREHPDIVKKYFASVIPLNDNKFAALNTAVWSGGSFIYVPKGVHVKMPLQAYFRINAPSMGQFERTLIIVDEGASVHYIEGCTAPIYSTDSLHSAVVEIIVKKNARAQYTTIQNWSTNVYNLVTKRAYAYENAEMFWLDCNIGSKITMKYPSIFLKGDGARGEIQSLAFAGRNQHQDAGGKVFHLAKNTSSKVVSKSISKDGGRTSYRGFLGVSKGAKNSKSHVSCDALIFDSKSRSDTYPVMKISEKDTIIAHEATVSKIGEEQLFYLMSRGLSEEQAINMIVNGFAMPIIKKLPMEYAIELNRLIELEMTGSVG